MTNENGFNFEKLIREYQINIKGNQKMLKLLNLVLKLKQNLI